MNFLNNTDIISNTISLFDSGSVSRKSLSESLGISVSSAGIVMSKFISMGIVHEFTHSTNSPGRNSKSATLNRDPVFAICQISSDYLISSFFGYDLKIRKTYHRMIEDPIFIDDAVSSFLRDHTRVKTPLKSICFVTDGHPTDYGFRGCSTPGVDSLPIRDMISEYLPDTVVYLENKASWCLADPDGINVIYVEVNGNPKITVIHNGKILDGRYGTAGNIGGIRDLSGRSYFARIKYADNKNDYVSALSDMLYSVILLLDPHNIYINTDRYSAVDAIIRYVKEKLITEYKLNTSDIPPILGECDSFDISMPLLRRKIRNDSIISMIMSSEK